MRYGLKSYEQLLLLRAEIEQLEPEAQDALRAEMRHRKLSPAPAEQEFVERELEDKIDSRRSAARQFSGSRMWYGMRDRILLGLAFKLWMRFY